MDISYKIRYSDSYRTVVNEYIWSGSIRECMQCISCGYEHDEKFCPNCGQRNGVEKITFTSIIRNAISTITSMDKGFLYNVKALILNPGKLTKDYIKGKRKGILNPVSYLIFATTIYLVVITLIKAPATADEILSQPKRGVAKIAYEVGLFMSAYIKYFWIFSIVPLGVSLRLLYQRYNYPEHIAISSFIIAQATIIGIFSYLIFKRPLIGDPIVFITIFWLTFKIFKGGKTIVESLLMALATLVLFFIQWFMILVAIGALRA